MKLHILLFIAALITYVSANEDWSCQKGVSYKENDCNSCQCSPSGLACGRRLCAHEEYEEMMKCSEYGKVTQRGCNTCVCTKDYGTVCTNNKC